MNTLALANPETLVDLMVLQPSFQQLHLWEELLDPLITEIQIVGEQAWIKKGGRKYPVTHATIRKESLSSILMVLAGEMSDSIGPHKPYLDARLPLGYRLAATIKPLSPLGTVVTIRKFGSLWTLEELYQGDPAENRFPMMEEPAYRLLQGITERRENTLISGSTDSGKTTLLKGLLRELPEDLRIVTAEKPIELQFIQQNTPRFEVVDGTGPYASVSLGQIISIAMRHSPEYLVVGEVRDTEGAVGLLEAMGTGHKSISTIHANHVKKALRRAARLASGAYGGDLTMACGEVADAVEYGVHVGTLGYQRTVLQIARVDRYNHATHEFIVEPLYQHPQFSLCA